MAERRHVRVWMAGGDLAGHHLHAGGADGNDEPGEVRVVLPALAGAGNEDLVGKGRGCMHPHLAGDHQAIVALADHADGGAVELLRPIAEAEGSAARRKGQEPSGARQVVAVGDRVGDLRRRKVHDLEGVKQPQGDQGPITGRVGHVAAGQERD